MTDMDRIIDQIERVLQPKGRCLYCGGGEYYWKHDLNRTEEGVHPFRGAKELADAYEQELTDIGRSDTITEP